MQDDRGDRKHSAVSTPSSLSPELRSVGEIKPLNHIHPTSSLFSNESEVGSDRGHREESNEIIRISLSLELRSVEEIQFLVEK